MARTTGRSGFKMKSSPTKGKLGDFFSSLGNQLKAGQKERGIFSEKGKAEKKSRKAGNSKFQADVRRRQETNKAKRASNKADAEYYGSAEDKAKNSKANRIKSTVTEEPKSKATTKYAQEFSGREGDEMKYRVSRKQGNLKEGKESHDQGYYGIIYPESDVFEFFNSKTNQWETSKTKEGNKAIQSLYMDRELAKNRAILHQYRKDQEALKCLDTEKENRETP